MPALAALVFASLAPKPPTVVVLEGFRPSNEAIVSKKAMRYLPFTVPKGVTLMDVRSELDYGPTKERGVADMGLFDPRGYGPGGPGFRGWQGGAGSGFRLTGTTETTSPWYISGSIQPGVWNLAQYYLRSTPAGLKYKYTITLTYGPEAMPRKTTPFPGPDQLKLSEEPAYYSGNLHCHSTHSDGGRSFPELIQRNKDFGFQFVASTEHNTPTAIYDFPKAERIGPLLLIGTELTTPGGHAGIIGQRPGYWWDFRTDPGDGGLKGIIREVRSQHAVFIMNHPFATCTTCTWTFPTDEWAGANGVEVWNSAWNPFDEQALKWWDGLLREGYHLNAYGGTDYHRGEDPLIPATWTYGRGLNREAILDGLRAGHTILSNSAKDRRLDVKIDGQLPGDTLRQSAKAHLEIRLLDKEGGQLTAFDNHGKVDLTPDSPTLDLRGRTFIRFELRNPDTRSMLAMTNAFFIGK